MNFGRDFFFSKGFCRDFFRHLRNFFDISRKNVEKFETKHEEMKKSRQKLIVAQGKQPKGYIGNFVAHWLKFCKGIYIIIYIYYIYNILNVHHFEATM